MSLPIWPGGIKAETNHPTLIRGKALLAACQNQKQSKHHTPLASTATRPLHRADRAWLPWGIFKGTGVENPLQGGLRKGRAHFHISFLYRTCSQGPCCAGFVLAVVFAVVLPRSHLVWEFPAGCGPAGGCGAGTAEPRGCCCCWGGPVAPFRAGSRLGNFLLFMV